jgi:flagellar hook-associated protein 1 FlgK
MIPTYMGLQTALSGLEAAQAAINTTGQNIANANTPGYSRQQVGLTERGALTIPSVSAYNGHGIQLGTGADITNITRLRNQFLDGQYRAQNTATSGNSTLSTLFGQVQSALNEPSGSGLSSSLQQFWQSWSALANNPGSQGAQQAVLSAGGTVAQGLNVLSNQLSQLESQVSGQYAGLTSTSSGPIASDANAIALLNNQIAQATSAGLTPNNLLDQRDQLIDDLSQYGPVNVTAQSNGMVNVSFGNAATAAAAGTPDGTPLVNGNSVNLGQNLTDTNLSGSGGTLGALLSMYDPTTGTGTIPTYMSTLDGIANDLVTTVNGAISSADAKGPSAPPFFSPTGTTAATIQLNPALAASGSNPPYTAAEANAVGVLAGGTTDQDYDGFVTEVGADTQAAQNAQQTRQALLTAIGNQRESISGVSLDEEMTNLIQFQQAYQASARVMNTLNTTMSALLSMVGG